MKNQKPLISVVIPSYNRANTILQCLETVLNQSYPNIEVVIADDGSTDETPALFENYPDQRVRYYHYSPNMGACHARNYGAQRSRGDYIAFQDSDDYWHPDKLQKQFDYLNGKNADFVFCGMNRVSEKGSRYYFPVSGFNEDEDAITQLLLENRVGTQTMFMRREVWEEVRFDEGFKRYQDWDFALRVAAKYELKYLPEPLVDSRVSGDSISSAVKSVPALVHLYERHESEFLARPQCLARYYRRMAVRLKDVRPREAASYFKKAWRISKKPRDFISHILCFLRRPEKTRQN